MKTEITKIVVENNQIVVFKKTVMCLGMFTGKKDLARFAWLGEEYTKVLPTFSGYGYAYNAITKKWVPIDIYKKFIETGKKQYDQIPTDLIQSKVVGPNDWDASALKIPVHFKGV